MQVVNLSTKINDSDSKIPFELRTLKWVKENRWHGSTEPIRLCHFVIIWIRKGSGSILIDMNKYEVTDNSAYCISPGQIHKIKTNPEAEGCLFYFTSEFVCLTEDNYELLYNSGLFNTISQSPVIAVNKELGAELNELSEKMMKEYDNYFGHRSSILRGYLKIFLIHLTRQFTDRTEIMLQGGRNFKLIANFFSLLEKAYHRQKLVKYYASELGVTANYLNEIIKNNSGVSASVHIRNRIILEAKRSLSNIDLTLKEISYDLGFDDTAHFSKYFKNATGLSFTDYKKQLSSTRIPPAEHRSR